MKARLTPEADLDAQNAVEWYDRQSSKLGDDFLGWLPIVNAIQKNPEQYPVIHQQMRRALVKRFPYEVIYEIENGEVIIYAIYHCARDPEQKSQETRRRHEFVDHF